MGFIFVTVCVHYEWKRNCACFLIVYICLVVGYPIAKRGRVMIPFIGLTPAYCCFWRNPRPGLATWRRGLLLSLFFFILNSLRWEVIARFVDMGGMELLTIILFMITPIHWIWVSEWVSDYCLTPIQQFFSYIMARTS